MCEYDLHAHIHCGVAQSDHLIQIEVAGCHNTVVFFCDLKDLVDLGLQLSVFAKGPDTGSIKKVPVHIAELQAVVRVPGWHPDNTAAHLEVAFHRIGIQAAHRPVQCHAAVCLGFLGPRVFVCQPCPRTGGIIVALDHHAGHFKRVCPLHQLKVICVTRKMRGT